MGQKSADRSSHFPAIEKKYGKPKSYWFAVMQEMAPQKYPEQIADLELVIAWNTPMLKRDGRYIFGVSVPRGITSTKRPSGFLLTGR